MKSHWKPKITSLSFEMKNKHSEYNDIEIIRQTDFVTIKCVEVKSRYSISDDDT